MNWFKRTKTPRTAGLVVERNGEFKLKIFHTWVVNHKLAEISFVEVDTTESLPLATTPSPPTASQPQPGQGPYSPPQKAPKEEVGFPCIRLVPSKFIYPLVGASAKGEGIGRVTFEF